MTISVIGSGKIVGEVLKMLRQELPAIKPVSIFAHRNIERAEALMQEFGIAELYTDFDALLRQDKADVLYIANVNTTHYEFAKKALLAGRHVIVEKPICMTVAETEELIALARQKRLMLVEAVSLLHMPNIEAVRRQLPSLGRIRMIRCDYSQYSSRYDRYLQGIVEQAFDPAFGGGALRDLNVYNINFMTSLFGMPRSAEYKANLGYNGIDTSGMLVMQYPDFQCLCSAAKDCDGVSHALIQGERGMLYIEGPVSVLKGFKVSLRNADGSFQSTEYNENQPKHRLFHEFETFLRIYESGDFESLYPYQDISLNVMKIIESS